MIRFQRCQQFPGIFGQILGQNAFLSTFVGGITLLRLFFRGSAVCSFPFVSKHAAVHIFSYQVEFSLPKLIENLARVCLFCALVIKNIVSFCQIPADAIERFHVYCLIRLFAIQKSRHLRIAPQHSQSTKSQKEYSSNDPSLTAAFRSYIQLPTPPLNILDFWDQSRSSL